ncbi:MAG: hypothetical protein IIY04_05585 [Oscillospiraceae bacterium]|nr:hypothetical protein [Oscillospiraceae bacterium]
MNKNRFFLVSMLLVSVLLFLLRLTGLIPHVIVSVIGLAIMIPLTIKTKSEWKLPALEIVMRVMYLVAIVTGGMLMKLHGIAALGIVHKISAGIFVLLLLVLYLPKWKK